MHLVAGPCCQPPSDFLMLVGCVVVYYQVNVQLIRHICLDVLQKLEEFLMAVARLALGQNLTRENIQGSKERGRTMSSITMGYPLHITQSEG